MLCLMNFGQIGDLGATGEIAVKHVVMVKRSDLVFARTNITGVNANLKMITTRQHRVKSRIVVTVGNI